jgi:hypothetical protein
MFGGGPPGRAIPVSKRLKRLGDRADSGVYVAAIGQGCPRGGLGIGVAGKVLERQGSRTENHHRVVVLSMGVKRWKKKER